MNIPQLLRRVRTPNKVPRLVVAPSYVKGAFDSHAVDCPSLFGHKGRHYMAFVGWDTIGYRTGLAVSDDLLTWHKEGLILDRGPAGSPTEFNVAMTGLLRDNDLFGSGEARRVKGRFVGTYHAYPQPGYETGPAVIGLCFSDDLRRWEVGPPVLTAGAPGGWDSGGLYKSWIMEHDGTYYLFYNAKNDAGWPWKEQTGAAISTDLQRWEKCVGSPVIPNGPAGSIDEIFASDPVVLRDGDTWVMFYYILDGKFVARDTVAFSSDLLHWEKSNEVLIDVGPAGSIDSRYAHKPGIAAKGGRLFHFYCAVAPATDPKMGQIEHSEVRGISVAHS